MSTSGPFLSRLTVAAAACLGLLALTAPSALAAPTSDGQGYVDSTARCATAAATIAFGSTASSRVAICKSAGGQYEYRGVRVRDGARLIIPASQSGDGGFAAENDGITYTVTANALVISAGSQVIRREPMVDFHQLQTPSAPSAAPATPSPAAPPPATPTPTTPLPPPLAAEVGGSGH